MTTCRPINIRSDITVTDLNGYYALCTSTGLPTQTETDAEITFLLNNNTLILQNSVNSFQVKSLRFQNGILNIEQILPSLEILKFIVEDCIVFLQDFAIVCQECDFTFRNCQINLPPTVDVQFTCNSFVLENCRVIKSLNDRSLSVSANDLKFLDSFIENCFSTTDKVLVQNCTWNISAPIQLDCQRLIISNSILKGNSPLNVNTGYCELTDVQSSLIELDFELNFQNTTLSCQNCKFENSKVKVESASVSAIFQNCSFHDLPQGIALNLLLNRTPSFLSTPTLIIKDSTFRNCSQCVNVLPDNTTGTTHATFYSSFSIEITNTQALQCSGNFFVMDVVNEVTEPAESIEYSRILQQTRLVFNNCIVRSNVGTNIAIKINALFGNLFVKDCDVSNFLKGIEVKNKSITTSLGPLTLGSKRNFTSNRFLNNELNALLLETDASSIQVRDASIVLTSNTFIAKENVTANNISNFPAVVEIDVLTNDDNVPIESLQIENNSFVTRFAGIRFSNDSVQLNRNIITSNKFTLASRPLEKGVLPYPFEENRYASLDMGLDSYKQGFYTNVSSKLKDAVAGPTGPTGPTGIRGGFIALTGPTGPTGPISDLDASTPIPLDPTTQNNFQSANVGMATSINYVANNSFIKLDGRQFFTFDGFNRIIDRTALNSLILIDIRSGLDSTVKVKNLYFNPTNSFPGGSSYDSSLLLDQDGQNDVGMLTIENVFVKSRRFRQITNKRGVLIDGLTTIDIVIDLTFVNFTTVEIRNCDFSIFRDLNDALPGIVATNNDSKSTFYMKDCTFNQTISGIIDNDKVFYLIDLMCQDAHSAIFEDLTIISTTRIAQIVSCRSVIFRNCVIYLENFVSVYDQSDPFFINIQNCDNVLFDNVIVHYNMTMSTDNVPSIANFSNCNNVIVQNSSYCLQAASGVAVENSRVLSSNNFSATTLLFRNVNISTHARALDMVSSVDFASLRMQNCSTHLTNTTNTAPAFFYRMRDIDTHIDDSFIAATNGVGGSSHTIPVLTLTTSPTVIEKLDCFATQGGNIFVDSAKQFIVKNCNWVCTTTTSQYNLDVQAASVVSVQNCSSYGFFFRNLGGYQVFLKKNICVSKGSRSESAYMINIFKIADLPHVTAHEIICASTRIAAILSGDEKANFSACRMWTGTTQLPTTFYNGKIANVQYDPTDHRNYNTNLWLQT